MTYGLYSVLIFCVENRIIPTRAVEQKQLRFRAYRPCPSLASVYMWCIFCLRFLFLHNTRGGSSGSQHYSLDTPPPCVVCTPTRLFGPHPRGQKDPSPHPRGQNLRTHRLGGGSDDLPREEPNEKVYCSHCTQHLHDLLLLLL